MFRADLHCHTTCSDGSLTPVQLIEAAKKAGLCGLAITDHDTIDAYETAIPAAKTAGIRLGSGVEFSSDYLGMSVHILGYDYALGHPLIREFCARHQMRRLQRNRLILTKLARLNMPIQEFELYPTTSLSPSTIGRPHIAELMVSKGYVSTFKEAFNLYLGEGKCCYDPGESFSPHETIRLIHEVGGKAFLAHPHLLENFQKVKELLKLGFDGIECYYAKCTRDQEKRWLKIAKERGLLMSGGSDFHGKMKPHIPLGSSWVDEATFDQIFQNPL